MSNNFFSRSETATVMGKRGVGLGRSAHPSRDWQAEIPLLIRRRHAHTFSEPVYTADIRDRWLCSRMKGRILRKCSRCSRRWDYMYPKTQHFHWGLSEHKRYHTGLSEAGLQRGAESLQKQFRKSRKFLEHLRDFLRHAHALFTLVPLLHSSLWAQIL